MKKIVAMFLVCVMLLCCASCVSNNSTTQSTDSTNSTTTTTTTFRSRRPTTTTGSTTTTTKRVLENPNDPNDIVIYAIDRDDFQTFLKAPSYEFLADKAEWTYSYLEDGERYMLYGSCGSIDFAKEQEVVDFLTDPAAIQAYLVDHQIQGTIEQMAIFEVPNMPITMWVKTTEEVAYMTIFDHYEEETYRLYAQDEFNDRNTRRVGKLFYQGKEIDTPNAPIIYGGDADVPLIAILKAVGATVEEIEEGYFAVSKNDQTYLLDIQVPEMVGIEDDWDRLMVAGGLVYLYAVDGELMVSDCIATTVLMHMDVNAYVAVDTENARVVITER